MTQPDDLIDSYRAAQKLQEKLQDSAGPSELTRRRILAYAEQLSNNKSSKDAVIISENTTDLIAKEATNTLAANDSQWKIRVFASVAVFGIAGLLMLQLSREAPDEFLPKATPSASAERSPAPAAPAIAENESKSAADKTVPAPLQAPAPPPAAAVAKPTPSIPRSTALAPAPKSEPQREQITEKSDAASPKDLETAAAKEAPEPRAEARADKAAEVAQSLAPAPSAAPSAAAASPAAASSAPTAALAPMADSAKLSRSAQAAPRARVNEAINANAKLFAAIQTKDLAALKLALDGGEDKNAKNAEGTPAVSLCVQSEQLNLLRLLIAAGADVNAIDARGVSPLAHARNRGFTDIVNILLNSGAK
jgi:outer membrane biosynthesis protein TonB